jgi:hypothetical protein
MEQREINYRRQMAPLLATLLKLVANWQPLPFYQPLPKVLLASQNSNTYWSKPYPHFLISPHFQIA